MRTKGLIENLYKKNKAVAVGLTYLLVLIVVETGSTFFFQHIKTINYIKKTVLTNEQKIKDMEKENSKLTARTYNIVLRQNFNAYVARKADEYHHQENFNDEITLKLGLLEGRFSVIEHLFYDLNRSQLQERRINNGIYQRNSTNS